MRRICSVLVSMLLAAQAGAATRGEVLVAYSFDDPMTDTGPDTFAIFQNAKGHVRLVSHIHFSGYRAIELRDVANDGDFPELQGYFPERKSGELFFHFAMLVANPEQNLNVALAGPSHFTLSKDGIAFWLKTNGGVLYHVSDSIPKKLFAVDPFTWYAIDVRYDIEKGSYDLAIRREGNAAPLVDLKNQPNATSAPGSSVDKFSFVGSVFEDDSNVTYYVDDVVIGTDRKLVLGPFVAPGRRKLFIDYWREAKQMLAKSRCAEASVAKLYDGAVEKARRSACAGGDDAEDRYFTMLWNDEFAAAARLAEENGWSERAGDALFLSGSPSMARKYYEQALREEPGSYWPTVKLADVFHLLGDTQNEKLYRQKMYGRLEE